MERHRWMHSSFVSGAVSLIAFMVVKYIAGLRVNEEAEREGLDIASHGEAAYEH
jgi:ammonium transporter, Amt family